MGSPCQMQFYAKTASKARSIYQRTTGLLGRLEKKYSRYRGDSLLSKINQTAGTGTQHAIDPETATLLHYAQQCYVESDGLFDVTAGVLRKIWDFKENKPPDTSQINALLPLIGWEKVEWNEHAVYLPSAGMELDFGGIVKEYAADAAAALCLQAGVNSGVVELGGDIRVLGPRPDGQGWPIAIRDPQSPNKTVAKLEIKAGALASSGDYERYLELEGIRYSHILNPKTGWPSTGLSAVSVIAEHCIVAGSLATITMLKGASGPPWLKRQNLPFFCCLTDGRFINQLQ